MAGAPRLDAAAEQRILERVRLVAGGEAPAEGSFVGDVERLFAAHQDRVYAICYRFVRDPERANELAQETLLTAWRKLPEFRGDSRFGTWLYGIARGLCFNAVRRKQDLLSSDGVIETESPEQGALHKLRRREREELLRAAAAAVLDPQEQEAVHLRYVEHLPQARITDLLGLDEASGARGVLQRCRRKLQRELRQRLAELGHGTSFVWESR